MIDSNRVSWSSCLAVARRQDDATPHIGVDAEWRWCPSDADHDISIQWRLDHITDLLRAPKNWIWLGLPTPDASATAGAARTASSACTALAAAYADLRAVLSDAAPTFGVELGPVAGPFELSTRRAFVLHLADELIHHGAEASLLHDLYAGRSR